MTDVIPDVTTTQQRAAFLADGAVVLRGVFADWVDVIAEGIEANLASPGPYAADNVPDGQAGRFWDDYCNWSRIEPFERVIRDSDAAQIAGELMASRSVQLFHDHVLVKEPHTPTETPWHNDSPYYFVEGSQTVSLWVPIDPVSDASLRLIAGSHRWDKDVLPTRWLAGDAFYDGIETSIDDYLPVPDPDAEPDRHRILEWQMEPGDAVAFHYRCAHGARGNTSDHRRRAFSMRFVGDDARYVERPGPTSPPFPDHGMHAGERLRDDWFPILIG